MTPNQSSVKPKKIELCAGYRPEKLGHEWIRHDMRFHEHITMVCDVWDVPSLLITDGLLPMEVIYCKNFLEHLSITEGKFFIRMCRNMLAVDGFLALQVPNMDWLIEQYRLHTNPEYFIEWFFGGTGDEWWNLHKTMYNEELLFERMQEGGFKSSRIKIYNEGYPLKVVAYK